jgi:DNA repair exonuclease SbcCD ATPase subunit
MKTTNLLSFALFITITALVSGCQKTDANLQSENADLKARVQQLEQQLQASKGETAAAAPSSAAAGDVQSQLAEAQKKADAAADELKSLSSQVDGLKQKIDQLTQQLNDARQARQKAEQALQLYQDKAGAALKQFQGLRRTLGGPTTGLDAYHQNYLATQSTVADLLAALPESFVRRQIAGVLAGFTHLNDIWETAGRQMQARTQKARAEYDKFVAFGGLGPNRLVVELGKEKILAPAEQDNAATAASRNQQMLSVEKDLDLGIEKLQALVNGQPT